MRKKRQVQTGTGKKAYKRKPLTRAQASARTKKGWVTKRRRYRYGAQDPEEKQFRRFQKERKEAAAEELNKHLYGDDTVPGVRSRFSNTHHDEQKALQEQLGMIAKDAQVEINEDNQRMIRFKDPETERFIRNLPPEQKREFALRMAQSEMMQSMTSGAIAKEHKNDDETDIGYKDRAPEAVRFEQKVSRYIHAPLEAPNSQNALRRQLVKEFGAEQAAKLDPKSREEINGLAGLLVMAQKNPKTRALALAEAGQVRGRIAQREETRIKTEKREKEAVDAYILAMRGGATEPPPPYSPSGKGPPSKPGSPAKKPPQPAIKSSAMRTDENGNVIITGGPKSRWDQPGEDVESYTKKGLDPGKPTKEQWEKQLVLQGQDQKPQGDPRLKHFVEVEDLYRANQREYTTPPKTRRERLERTSIGRQLELERTQAQWKLNAIRTGNFSRFYDDSGEMIGNRKGGVGKASHGIVPEYQYDYRLRRKPDMTQELTGVGYRRAFRAYPDDKLRAKRVDPWDVDTKFHEGTRDRYRRMHPGEYDEIVSANKISRFPSGPVRAEFGERHVPGRSPDKFTEKEIFIEKEGVKPGEIIPAGSREGTTNWTQHYIRERAAEGDDLLGVGGPGWKAVDEWEYNIAEDRNRDTKQIPKKVRTYHVAPGTTQLKNKEKDVVYVKTPPLKLKGGKEIVAPHALFVATDENSSGWHRAVKYGYIEPKRVEQRWKEQDADDAREDFKKAVAGASIATMGWKLKDRTKDRAAIKADSIFGKGINSVGGKFGHPDAATEFSLRFGPHREVAEGLLEDSIGRGKERAFGMRHPMTGRTGAFPKVYHRKFAITPATRHARALEEDLARLERMNTRVASNIDAGARPGLKAGLRRWRREAILENRRYVVEHEGMPGGNFQHLVDQTRHILEGTDKEGNKVKRKVGDIVELRHPVRGTDEPVVLTENLLKTAQETKKRAYKARWKDNENVYRLGQQSSAPWKHHVFPRVAQARAGHGFPLTKNEKIGGAVAGAALLTIGSAYLYHRYKNKKRMEAGEEPIAFYNKILPPAVTTPFAVPTRKGLPPAKDALEAVVPGWQTTKRWQIGKNDLTEFLMIDGNKIPVAGQINLDRKRFAFRPVDRGYTPDAKLGVPRIHIGGKYQGKVRDKFFVDIDRSVAQKSGKRSWTKKGKTIKVKGKDTPFFLDVGKAKKMKLKGTNKARITDTDREDIVAAFAGTDEEHRVKAFYSAGRRDKIVDWFEDPEMVEKIKRKKGVDDEKRAMRTVKLYSGDSYEKIQMPLRTSHGDLHFGENAPYVKDRSGRHFNQREFYGDDWLHANRPPDSSKWSRHGRGHDAYGNLVNTNRASIDEKLISSEIERGSYAGFSSTMAERLELANAFNDGIGAAKHQTRKRVPTRTGTNPLYQAGDKHASKRVPSTQSRSKPTNTLGIKKKKK